MFGRPLAPLLLALLAGLAVSVGVAACGGTQINADEVIAAPPELTIPTQGSESADALADPESSSTPDPSGTTSTGTDTAGSTPQPGDEPAASGGSASGGAAATPTPQPEATTAPSNSGGSQAPAQSGSTGNGSSGTEKFEEFCQQNAGAC